MTRSLRVLERPVGPEPAGAFPRIAGIDLARGAALLGMMAVHILPIVDDDGNPSVAWELLAGRSAALFAVLAGVGIALTTGGPRAPGPGERAAASASVAVRAALLLLLGLALGAVSDWVHVILAYYGVLFLLAIPVLGLSPRRLVALSAAAAVTAPLLVHGLRDHLPEPPEADPSLGLLGDPLALLSQLLVTGVYPALPWVAYLCAGLAIGRLLRPSAAFGGRLLVVGLALAAASWLASAVLLGPLGGLAAIRSSSAGMAGWEIDEVLVWGPDPTLPTTTWWWLATRGPHSGTPFDLVHTVGSSMVVLGLALLLPAAVARAMRPLAAAGAMTLTLYSAHVVLLEADVLPDRPYLLFTVQAAAAIAFAVHWRGRVGQGPLERAVTSPARRARAAVQASARRTTSAGSGSRAP